MNDLGKLMREQDNRSTASPYLYVLQAQRKVYANDFENPDGKEYYDSDYDSGFDSIEEARKHFIEDGYDNIDQRIEDLVAYEYKFYWEDVNWFFTKEALDKHLRANRHRYGKTRDYVKYCLRNPEMEYVQKVMYNGFLDAAIEALELIKTKHPSCDCMDTAGIANEALDKIYKEIPWLKK